MVRPISSIRQLGFKIGLSLFVILAWVCVRTYHPPFPNPLAVDVTVGPAHSNANLPLITTGRPGIAEFLFLRWDESGRVQLGYDRWGLPGILSAPLTLEPGSTHRLLIQFPGLALQDGNENAVSAQVRVLCDGREVLNCAALPVFHNHREIYFGENPLGGATSEPGFDGTLRRIDGHVLRGYPRNQFSGIDRLIGWLTYDRWNALFTLVVSLAGGWLAAGLVRSWRHRSDPRLSLGAAMWRHRWFLLGAMAGGWAFVWLITDGSYMLIYPESLGGFYDYQARSLLAGHLDVPPEAIGAEAFIFQGRTYGYFGVFPAILRIPFVIYDWNFGEWSRTYMLAFYAASLVAAYVLLIHFIRLRRGPAAAPSALSTVLLTVNVGMGSTLLFLASRAYVYHEAILGSVAFGLWSLYFTAKYSESPRWRPAGWALALGLCSVQCRPAVGLFALACLGGAAVVHAWSDRRTPRRWLRREFPIAVLSLAALLTFNVVSYLKFHTFSGLPLQYHNQYSSHPERLARFEGKDFHLSNLRFNADTYFLHFNARWIHEFPGLVSETEDQGRHPEIKYDIAERTLALPYSMAALTALALAGVLAGWSGGPAFRRVLLAVMIGAAPLLGVLLLAVASSQRYTGDFVPLLIVLACAGLSVMQAALWGKVAQALLLPITAGAILVTFALALHYQGDEVWGVPEAGTQHYKALAHRFNDRWFKSSHSP